MATTLPPPRPSAPLGNEYLELRAELGTALFALSALAAETKAPEVTLTTLAGLQAGLREPLLFVVVGEVKAGKSSLLNALFGRDFCHTDVLPATDRVHVFKYGEPARDVPISPALVERYQPIPFLRDFHIVDTPGTNTIVAEHQEITEGFVPQADLILFVFSVVNPWAASAWQFLDLLQKKWLKNVVFVLQQADLRDEREVETIVNHLRQTAMQKLGQAFPVFPVSAKKALLAKTSGVDKDRLWAESRFAEFERYVNGTLGGGPGTGSGGARMEKLRSVAGTARVLLREIGEGARNAEKIIAEDRAQLTQLQATAEQMKKQSRQQVGGFLRNIEQAFDRCRDQGEQQLRTRLSLWGTLRLAFGRDRDWEQRFQRDLEANVREAITGQIEHALGLLEGELKHVWTQLHDSLHAHFRPEARAHLGAGSADYTEQRTRLLERIELAMVERMGDDTIERELQSLFAATGASVRLPATAAAAGIASLIATVVAHSVLLDITGFLATAVAAGGTLYAAGKRRRVLAAFRERMDAKRQELTQAIGDHLLQAIDVFYQKLGQLYAPLETFSHVQEERYRPMLERIGGLERQFQKIAARLGRGGNSERTTEG